MRMKDMLWVVWASSFVVLPPTFATEAVSTVATNAEANELAEILVGGNMNETTVENALVQITSKMFADQPDIAALNELYPGTLQLFIDTMRPIVLDEVKRVKPLYSADLAQFFSAKFSSLELRELVDFWRSPEAQGVLASALANINYSAISDELVSQIDSDEDIVFSEGAAKSDVGEGARKAGLSASPGERAAFLRFSLSPVGRKFLQLKDEKLAIDMKWLNAKTPPEMDSRIESDITAALERHIKSFEEQKPTS